MSSTNSIADFLVILETSISSANWVKLSLGNYLGDEVALKQLFVKPISLKKGEFMAFNYRYQTRDIHKNLEPQAALLQISEYLASGFRIATLFTKEKEYIFEILKDGKTRLRVKDLKIALSTSHSHDKSKNRLVASTAPFLQKLGLANPQGEIFKQAQDKYRQIDKFIEILRSLIAELDDREIEKVLDMGSGKGYLTFAMYDYLTQQQGKADVVGVEYRQDMVDLCNGFAGELNFEGLHFEKGTIDDYEIEKVDLLIALHACDTATDDAIAKGIQAHARLIVVAPCCHKQIRREMERSKVSNELDFLTKYGIFLERQAEMVTDGLRTLVLAYFGYKTKAFQFVSDVHTPKNVMLVGIKGKPKNAAEKQQILQKIKDTKAFFGITYHHLERVLGLLQ